MPYVLTCLACLRADEPTCLACLPAHVPTDLVCLRAHVPTCFACSRAHMPTCLASLHAHALRAHVLTYLARFACLRALTTNNKDKFSIIYLIIFCFFLWNKIVAHSCISLTSQKPLTGIKLCTIKWFDFCLNITLRFIFKWLIKHERWIIMHGG